MASPDCNYSGDPTCSDGIANEGTGTTPRTSPYTGVFQADGVNYRANLSECQALTFATTTDATFAAGDYVSKASTVEHWRGEIVCGGSFTAADYEVLLYYSLPIGPMFVWIKAGSTHDLAPDNAAATVLAQQNTPAWANNSSVLTITGSLANAFARTNSSTNLTLSLSGANGIFIKSEGGPRLGCIYLRKVGDTTQPTCKDEGGSGTPGHYASYKLSGSAPTACNDGQFDNANTWSWTGTSSTSETVPTLKLLHSATRWYSCITISDNDLRATTASNDVFPSIDDRWEFRWRDSTATTTRDATTFAFVVNPLNAKYSANFPDNTANASQSLNESCTVTLTGDIDSTADDTSYQIFCALDAGFTLTDGMQIRGNMLVNDADGTSTSSRLGCETSITNPAFWCLIDVLGTQVPGGGDVTDPVVTSPAVPTGSIEESTAIMTASTNEAGTCRVHYGTSTGNYTLQTAGSAAVNGVCAEALGLGGSGSQTDPPLTGNTPYFAVMKVTDSSNNTGTSSEVGFTTDPPAPPTCSHYAGPTTQGAADGSSDANRFLINSFWAVATAGSSLCLADGTYTGANSMIAPPSGKKGTSLAPIKITGTNDGGVVINGQGVRMPVLLNNDNDWFIIERLDAHNSNSNVFKISTNSDNNIFRRVCGWDAGVATNDPVFGITGNTNNLIEDACGFGTGRYIFAFTQGANNATCRRCWGVWQGSTASGPKNTFGMQYRAFNDLCENCIGTWSTVQASITQPFAILRLVGNNTGDPEDYNGKYLGSIAYLRSTGASNLVALAFANDTLSGHYEHVVTHSAVTENPLDVRNPNVGFTCSNCTVSRTTMIGADSTPSVGSQWTQSGNSSGANVAAVPNIWNGAGTTGARVCKRYVNGTLTATPLWPWPMDARINAALTTSGRDPDDYFGTGGNVTSLMESIFGTIPAECGG